MKTKAIPSQWLIKNGHRMDCNPYMGGAVEARAILEKLACQKQPLADLTQNIINAGRIKRVWADGSEYGLPFLSSTDILKADLSNIRYISKRAAVENPNLLIKKGWTLITRSGSIGNMAYARSDMDGMACTEDVLRVIPDDAKIDSGYLYAFLKSKYGLPIVISGTYGAIIQHIEPQHIAALPVPRLGDTLESEIHRLVEEAAELRVESQVQIGEAIFEFEKALGGKKIKQNEITIKFGVASVSSKSIVKRMDGAFHSTYHHEALQSLDESEYQLIELNDFCESIIEPPRVKRQVVANGVAFFGTSALQWLTPVKSYDVSKTQDQIDKLLVSKETVLMPRSGQVSGIIGKPMMPIGDVVGSAVSEDAIRINCKCSLDAGFVYVALKSEVGRRQLKARAYGTSIPHLDVHQIGLVRIPDLSETLRKKIGKKAIAAFDDRGKAIERECKAIAKVEQAIEQAAQVKH